MLSEATTLPSIWRLARFDLASRRWLMWPLRCMTLPVPVMWKRRLAPLCVFIFGIWLFAAGSRGRLLNFAVSGSEDGREEAPFHVGGPLDHRHVLELLRNRVEQG